MKIQQLNAIKECSGKMTTREIAEHAGVSVHQVQYYKKKEHLKVKPQPKFNGYPVQSKQLRIFAVAMDLCIRPLTIYAIANSLDTTVRTAYRYLTAIKALGVEIHEDEKGLFSINQCPCCKKLL